MGRGNGQSQQSAMRLMELGPRVTLELFKVEKGLCEGDVLYHKFEEKTPEEAARIKAKVIDSHETSYRIHDWVIIVNLSGRIDEESERAASCSTGGECPPQEGSRRAQAHGEGGAQEEAS